MTRRQATARPVIALYSPSLLRRLTPLLRRSRIQARGRPRLWLSVLPFGQPERYEDDAPNY